MKMVESFSIRLFSKFKKLGDAFRHFDRNFDNEISFKEFRIVCEEMDLRYSSDEVKLLFSYLDSDGGGTIGYKEFTKLLDENRLGLDPMKNMKN
jgi:Ca2+-binding EF-hand superfamily protein